MTFRIGAIAWKELRQMRRDRMTLAMMVVLPVMQLLLFGYAINTDVRHIPTIVYDQDKSAASRDLSRSMEATGFYDVIGAVGDYDEVERALRSGRAKVALVVPARYASDVQSGRSTKVQLVVDGSDPQTVASATNTAASLVAARSGELLVARLGGAARAAQPIELEPNTWYNPDLRTAVYVVPGLIGVILTMTMVLMTCLALTRERERGTYENLLAMPATPLEIMIGKIAPNIVIGAIQSAVILAVAYYIFHVPMLGSMPFSTWWSTPP